MDLEATDPTTNEVVSAPGTVVGLGIDSTYTALVYGWDLEGIGSLFTPWRIVSASLSWLAEPVSVSDVSAEMPAELRLGAHPNPFNPQTTVLVRGLVPGQRARFLVTNTLGQILVDREFVPASAAHATVWAGLDDQGRRLGSGVYLLSVRQGDRRAITRALLAR